MKYSMLCGVIEVYFDDLTEEAQNVWLEAMSLSSPNEGNYDVIPIFEAPIPEGVYNEE